MSLPGKLCIGILEEDNPLRSYFRFKPLLVDDNGRYVPYEGGPDYPQEGCIRIVPDKNESYHFKARMRQIGLFCVVDLREHPGESDKIRPNKNFRPDGDEINASIIYSDVVRAPAEDMIFELIPEDRAEAVMAAPRTASVLVRGEAGISPAIYTWDPIPGADGDGRISPTERACPVEALQIFDLPGFGAQTVSFAIHPSEGLSRLSDMVERPAPEFHAPEPRPAAPAPREPVEARPAEPQPETPAQPEPQPHAAPQPEAHAPAAPASPRPDKPWIHRDESMLPPPIDPRLSRAEQLRAAQAGLNPRRGRSLQELIDEKWQRSRLNQLGQPVAPIATGAPVKNPVESAIGALREAWRQPQLRQPLLSALNEIYDFRQSLETHREASRQSAITEELDALEAQKLQLMAELDRLKANTEQTRERLKQDIRRDEAAALADATRRTQAAKAEQAEYEQRAADARAAARDAQALIDQLSGEALEKKIRDVALTQRVLERLNHLKHAPAEAAPAAPERIDLEAFIQRAIARFEAEGWALTRPEAANLCVSLAVGPALILTGAPGSGKTAAARLLAEALGLKLSPVSPEARPHREGKRRRGEPALLLMDDANLTPGPDPLRGLCALPNPDCRLAVTLQDAHSGHPVCAAAWDAGFAVRLSPPDSLPWQPAPRRAMEAPAPASIEAIAEALPQAEVPTAVIARLDALRRVLHQHGADFSRRALNDAWRYVAAMLAALGQEADPAAILDLAVAQRLLPALIASAPVEALQALRPQLADMPACQRLLKAPLPVML